MDLLVQLQTDRQNLVANLEHMIERQAQWAAQIEQQRGAIQYVDMLLERIQNAEVKETAMP